MFFFHYRHWPPVVIGEKLQAAAEHCQIMHGTDPQETPAGCGRRTGQSSGDPREELRHASRASGWRNARAAGGTLPPTD
jgi:hypothetical protein